MAAVPHLQRPSRAKKRKRVFLKAFLKWASLMAIWGALFLCGIILWFGSELPDLEDLAKMPRHPSVILFDERGQTLASYGDFYGTPIRAEDLPSHVINALLAIEDRRFYHHWGVDPIGMVRAFKRNMEAGGVVQGGSTITQQLAKNFLQSKKIYSYQDRSLKRKISEALLAFQIEWRFTKNQILTMHLNRAYMGAGTWGLDAAAMKYFGRHAKELGLYESAVLMGLLKAPSRYSPALNYERSEGRAQQVLKAMVESGFISQEAAVAAMAMPVPLAVGIKKHSARYFTDWVMEHLHELVDTSEDLEVVTTLNLAIQRIAERQAQQVMAAKGGQWHAEQAALVSMKPDGAVQAMVGGMDYRASPFNRATRALRQPGSAFKYFVYLAALEEGYSPNSLVDDSPVVLGEWRPKNYRYKSQGEITLREAFARSVNAVAIRLAMDVGVSKVIDMARRMGITSALPRNYSLALGTGGVTLLEMTGAFAVMANEGYQVKPYGIKLVRNRKGTILFHHKPEPKNPLLDEETLGEMQSIMKTVVENGSGRLAKIPSVTIMAKTGTSNKNKDDRDVWFIGMTPQLVTGVWFGCDDEKPMSHQLGGAPSLHLWKSFNVEVLRYLKNPSLSEWDSEEGPPPDKAFVPQKPQPSKGEEEDDGDADEESDESSSEEPRAPEGLIQEIIDHMRE